MNYKRLKFMRATLLIVCLILTNLVSPAQGRLVLNGGKVNISNGAVLVVSNSAANAITRTSGHIISEGENNRVLWNIGTTAATYTLPWGSGNANYFPISFTTSAASGAGFFYFATVATAADNSATLPTGITNFNGAAGDDMSLVAVDRFWKVDAQSYSTKPTLTNLIFTYQDSEFASPNKTNVESKLTARRWNSVSNTWTDYNTGGTVNTTANTITIPSLTGTNLYPWWTMAYPGATYHWISASTSNWNNIANWSATAGGAGGLGVPGPGDAVWFDDVRDGNCNVDAAADMARLTMSSGYAGTLSQGANAVSVASNADLTAGTFTGGSGAITVNGNLNLGGVTFTSTSGVLDVKQNVNITAGSFSHNNGTVRFSGTKGTQLLSGSITPTFNNLDITNTSASPGLRIENTTNLAGIMTLGSNVVVDADGAADNKVLTLLSTADSPAKDAAIGILPTGASVTGKVTVQRYMAIEGSNNTRIYRYIASPVQHATVADLQQEISVTGTFTGTSACSGCGTAQSMFLYRESVTGDTNGNGINTADDGYIDFPDASNTEEMEPGRGYTVFVRGNTLSSAKWDVRGAITAGNVTPVTLPTTYTSSGQATADGWNLVGNPFPSTIDWNAASGWTKTNVDGAIYIRDNGNAISRYASWNGVVGTNGGSRYIAMGQAFWVKANGSGTPVLRATENIKAAGSSTTFFREKAPSDVFRITLVQGTNSDEAIIHFREDASDAFDTQADARKMANSGINLSTQIAGKDKLAINSLSKRSCNATVTVLADNSPAGNYTLNFNGLETFPSVTTILLIDSYTGQTINTRAQSSYAFTVTTDPLSAGNKRFTLTFNTPPANSEFAAAAAAVCSNTDGTVTLHETNADNTYSMFLNTKQVASPTDGASGTIQWSVAKDKLTSGVNTFTVRATPNNCGPSIEKQITLNVVPTLIPQSVQSDSVCRQGAVQLSASGAGENNTYRWYANEPDVTPLYESASSGFVTPVLSESKTYYVTIANSLGCEGPRISVPAKVIQYEDAQITSIGDSLAVNFNQGVQWFFNDDLLADVTSSSILPEAYGTYRVEVSIGSCTTTASYQRVEVITGIETDLRKSIQAYPNPVAEDLYLQVPIQVKNVQQVIVRNEQGQYIGRFNLAASGSEFSGTYSMKNLPSGLYILEIVTDVNRIPVKIIKQ